MMSYNLYKAVGVACAIKQEHNYGCRASQETGKVHMLRVWKRTAFLLVVPMWFHDLFGMHGRKLVGHDLQWHHMDMP